ncbi:MAG: hypothetical protein ACOCT9_02335 [archaeon]
MENWLIVLLIALAGFIVGFFIEPVRDIYEEIWEYIISFEWLSDIGEMFSAGFEAVSNFEESPLTNFWFYVFYAALMVSVWILPSAFGVKDYALYEKLLYTVLFFIITWFIVAKFQD